MYKSAIIGDSESVLGFMALGFLVNEASEPAMAAKILHKLAGQGDIAVIFITEELAREIGEDIARYKDSPLPAITVIPSVRGNGGYGMSNMREAVIRATGADMLFND